MSWWENVIRIQQNRNTSGTINITNINNNNNNNNKENTG
jgi:hypothetical protein